MRLPNTVTVLADSRDRDAWLEARRKVVTATDAHKIFTGGAAAVSVWKDKHGTATPIRQSKEMAYGLERETSILEWASGQIDTKQPARFEHNTLLVARKDDMPWMAATPDGWLKDGRSLVLCEVKTTKEDWREKGVPGQIEDQIQWQMAVTGASRCLLAVEIVQWEGDMPTPVDLWSKLYRRDRSRICDLIETAGSLSRRFIAGDDTPEKVLDLTDFTTASEKTLGLDHALTELVRLKTSISEMQAEAKEYEALIKRQLTVGRAMVARLEGTAGTATLSTSVSKHLDTGLLSDRQRAEITTWRETSRLTVKGH